LIYKETCNESKINARNGRCGRQKQQTGMAESGTKSVREEKRRIIVEGHDRRAQ
jgi:hypothetical protein